MRTALVVRLMLGAAAAAGLSMPGTPVVWATPAPVGQTCPPGQREDVMTPGFQCVSACPPGALVDGVSGACVAAPGVPPPPLP